MDIKNIKTQDASSKAAVQSGQQRQIKGYGNSGGNEQSLLAPSGADTVSFSTASRDLLKASYLLEKDEAARKDKVADIKRRIDQGVYKVDSQEVAKSLISFVADGSVV